MNIIAGGCDRSMLAAHAFGFVGATIAVFVGGLAIPQSAHWWAGGVLALAGYTLGAGTVVLFVVVKDHREESV